MFMLMHESNDLYLLVPRNVVKYCYKDIVDRFHICAFRSIAAQFSNDYRIFIYLVSKSITGAIELDEEKRESFVTKRVAKGKSVQC